MPTFEQEFQIAVQQFRAGRLDEARIAGEKLLKRHPKAPGLLQLLGEIAFQHGKLGSAENLLNKAVAGDPRDPHAHFRLGTVLLTMNKLDEAAQHYHRALRLKPDYWEARANLGLLWRAKGCFQKAREHLEQSLKHRPDSTAVFCCLLNTILSLGELSTVKAMSGKIKSVIETCITNDQERHLETLAGLIYMSPLLSVSKQHADALARKMDRLMNKGHMAPLFSVAQPKQKLRIGYVSRDFGDHPISHVMRGLFSQHDREQFHTIAYSIATRPGTADRDYAKAIQQGCDDYIDLFGLTIRQAAERIAADDVQILVNLGGYMYTRSLDVFSFRPAPIQVYWLGHGGGLGLSFIDYVIADAVVIPPGEELGYREKVVRLPEAYHCTDTPSIPDLPQSRAEHGLDDQAFVFCAFNNPNKIDSKVFDAWMNILRRVPDSQIWLSNPSGETALEHNLRAEAQQRGISPKRLVFAPRMADKSLHFARHRLADLFLDTFVYTAATTAIDALWAGLPIVTRRGNDFYSRICATLVTNVGLSDMICDSTPEYEDRAVYFASNRSALSAVQERLSRNRHREPLFDLPRFVQHLEDAYREMWQRHLSGEAPTSFSVAARPRAGI
jgi:predicted O-linked N-acetylglucosamine transferase (SPINDLY family)